MRERHKQADHQQSAAFLDELLATHQENAAFKRIRWYLYSQKKALEAERRVTAFYGCRTSWYRIERYALYFGMDSDQVPNISREMRGKFNPDCDPIKRLGKG
jgi:hypothetical protein